MDQKPVDALRIGVLISGRGSNLAALLEACASVDLGAKITLVMANNPNAPGLKTARDKGIAAVGLNHKDFSTRQDFESEMRVHLDQHRVELICLAGFMRLLSDVFIGQWPNKIINIHPSLLPAFRGLNTHKRVLASGVRISGCTTHFVREEMDEGPIIMQAAVPVHADDTERTLAGRVLACEHRIYPMTVRLLAQKRLHVQDERVLVDGVLPPRDHLIGPSVA